MTFDVSLKYGYEILAHSYYTLVFFKHEIYIMLYMIYLFMYREISREVVDVGGDDFRMETDTDGNIVVDNM